MIQLNHYMHLYAEDEELCQPCEGGLGRTYVVGSG